MTNHGENCGVENESKDTKLKDRMALVKHKVLVLSGKGGVGKSTVAVNLAFALSLKGKRVGILDIDIHGPSVPVMLGLENEKPFSHMDALLPVEIGDIKIMSIGFLLPQTDNAIIWRGPLKMKAIQQFLSDVEWGELDYLVVDAPPGTGDEPLSIAQMLPGASAVIVTTPQKVSTADVRKSISFCRSLSLPIIGVVENMNGLVCPKCGERIVVFPQGQAEKMAGEMNVPFLASLPMDPQVAAGADAGKTFAVDGDSPLSAAFSPLLKAVLDMDESDKQTSSTSMQGKGNLMRIAIPTAEGNLCNHFGHCEEFAFIDVNEKTKAVISKTTMKPPRHEPGVIPRWVSEQGATLVLAGGMGGQAIHLFNQAGVKVLTGCPAMEPDKLVEAYCNGTLRTGGNACGHDDGEHKCNH